MLALSVLLAIPLVGLAALHFLWAAGVWYPARDEQALVRAVVGLRGATRMPGPIPCALVGLGLLAAAIMPFLPPSGWQRAGVAVAALVFLVRGFVSFGRVWRQIAVQEPYATYDKTRYGPAALLLATGYIAVFVMSLP